MEKKFLAAGVVITGVFILAFSANNAQQKKAPQQSVSKEGTTITTERTVTDTREDADTIPLRSSHVKHFNGKITTDEDGKKYELVTENNTVKELYIDGKKIPADKIADHSAVISRILERTRIDMERSEKELAESNVELEASRKEMALSKIEMEASRKEMALSKIEMEKERDEMEKTSNNDRSLAKIEMDNAAKEMKLSQKEMEVSQEQMKIEMERSKKDMERSAKDMERSKKDAEASGQLQEEIVSDLMNEKIISNKKELFSYTLNNDELIVNGVKQPASVYKRFSDRYINNKKRTIEYRNGVQ